LKRIDLQQGMTLIELMAVLLIAAVLIGIAIPGMRTTTNSSRGLNAIGDISGMLARARSEASSRGKPITICVSADGATCSGTTTWESGWMMFVDDGNVVAPASPTTNSTHDTGEEIIQIGGAAPSNTTLTTVPAAASITFNSRGIPSNLTGGTFRYCGADKVMKVININGGGQVRLSTNNTSYTGAAVAACP